MYRTGDEVWVMPKMYIYFVKIVCVRVVARYSLLSVSLIYWLCNRRGPRIGLTDIRVRRC